MKTFDEWAKTKIDKDASISIREAWNAALAERDAETCEWKPTKHRIGTFLTQCGALGMKTIMGRYCPYCGKRIKTIQATESERAEMHRNMESEAKDEKPKTV